MAVICLCIAWQLTCKADLSEIHLKPELISSAFMSTNPKCAAAAATRDGGKILIPFLGGFSLYFYSSLVWHERADYNIWHLSDI